MAPACPHCACDRTIAVAGDQRGRRFCLGCGTRWTIDGEHPAGIVPRRADRHHPALLAKGTKGREARRTDRAEDGETRPLRAVHGTTVGDAVGALSEPLATRVLEALALPPAQRATLIGRLWRDSSSRAFAEFLVDLEENREFALALAAALRARADGPRGSA
jgi:hypothetical protein